MPIVPQDVLRRLAVDIFSATGIPADDAQIVANHLIESHLFGHDSHGTWFLPSYARSMKKGYVPWEDRDLIRENPAIALFDGKGGNGIVAVTRAVDLAVEKARTSTFGFVGLKSVSHIGRLGDYPPRIAEQGMLGMVWLNGGGLFLAPHGSADRRLRPEPIAFAAPRGNGLPPFMLDMTMTVVAGGKIEQKIIRGEPLPEGWVIDQQGNDVTDSEQYRAASTGVLPLGGRQFGHKGHGLAMMVEMLVGPLSHAGCTKLDGAGGGGVMVLAIDISAFTDLETYTEEVKGLAEWVCSARPLPGVDRIYAPGEIEQETRTKRMVDGIELPQSVWEGICEVAAELQVAVPEIA
ncbi:MAG: Ldh family oxidoreductase [Candidatus Latescibacterota bacterium]|nr:Ldh family oxidoreductase [Candidatus Latescibacterota bacterium]